MAASFVHRGHSVEVPIEDTTQVGEARRVATWMGHETRRSEAEISDIAIVATEMASNILKHAGNGHILVTRTSRSIELMAIDRGPGMTDVAECFADGFSTAGTRGNGLGAVHRLASRYDIFSVVENKSAQGTILWAAFDTPTENHSDESKFDIGALCIPYPGETAYGDGWIGAEVDGKKLEILLADGLGHGPAAENASTAATDCALRHVGLAPGKILEFAHTALRSTRGAAVGIAHITADRDTLSFAGVGNTVGAVCDGEQAKRVVSYDGTLGLQVRKIQEFTYAYPKSAVFVLHTDGIGTGWDLARYPGLLRRHPAIIAGILYRDFSRRKDDATILVVRRKGEA
jgi:anti-sigma regulatory factor (Ser/Thr protein kinase)